MIPGKIIYKLNAVKDHYSYRLLFIRIFLIITFAVIVALLSYYSPYVFFVSIKDILIGLITGILVFIINGVYSYCLNKSIRKNEKKKSYLNKKLSLSLVVDSLFSVLLVKICMIILFASIEEYIFRSYILSFTNNYFPWGVSIVINAIIFYAVHSNSKVLELLFMGIMFALITLFTNSITAAIIAHSCNNILVYFIRRMYIAKPWLFKNIF